MKTTHLIGAVVLLVAGGVVHGMWTHRWSGDVVREAGVDLLAKADAPLGDWKPEPARPGDDRNPPKGATAAARQFVNAKTNKRAVASVTVGVPGVVAAHTP